MEHIKEILRRESNLLKDVLIYPEKHRISTTFQTLDDLIGGFYNSELIIIGARPAMGKTAMLLNMALRQAKQGKKILFYSLEYSTYQFIIRMLKILSAMNLCGNSAVSSPENELLKTLEDLEKLPIYTTERIFTFDDLKNDLNNFLSHHQADVVYIDSLQFFAPSKNDLYRAHFYSRLISDINLLAKNHHIPIVVTSQLSRAVEVRGGDKKPQLSDLRETGALEETADKVIFLYRPEYYGISEDWNGDSLLGKAFFIVAKNNFGKCGECTTNFLYENMLFIDDYHAFECLDIDLEIMNEIKKRLGLM